MASYKIGATVEILNEFTVDEWANIYPYTSLTAEAEITGGAEYPLTTVVNEVNRTITITADTSTWNKGRYKSDMRFVKDGKTIFWPSAGYIEFELTAPVTEVGSEINT